jgi:prepilin-type processing-associated H-X9-DG protein
LEPYTGSNWEDELFSCPTGQPGRWRGVSQIGGYGEPIGNYGYNKVGCGLGGQMGDTGSQRIGELGLGGTVFDLQPPSSAPLAESGVKVPSDLIALADAMQRMSGHVVVVANATLMIDGIMLNSSDSIWGELEKPAKKRHNGSANVTFCDGHTESIKLMKLFGRSNATLRRWNNDNLPHRDRLFDR